MNEIDLQTEVFFPTISFIVSSATCFGLLAGYYQAQA
jgi:hypothetical protein